MAAPLVRGTRGGRAGRCETLRAPASVHRGADRPGQSGRAHPTSRCRAGFLHARLPRVRCPVHGVRQVGAPWAREGSGFTLLFEALLLQFAAAMPVRKVAEMTREQDTRIRRVLHHHGPRR